MDISEVDQATTVVGTLAGGPSGIGANPGYNSTAGTVAGLIGSATGTASYQEAPTVRYIPLAGQALIAQVATPLSAEAIANLISSDWDLASVLTLGIDRVTPGYLNYDAATNAIIELDKYGAIIIAATQSSDENKTSKVNGLSFSTSPPPAKDALTIYFEPKHIRTSFRACDDTDDRQSNAQQIVNALWKRLQTIYGAKNARTISISSKASPSLGSPARAPFLNTRSAIGILKAASEQDTSPTIYIKPEYLIRQILKKQKDHSGLCEDSFYTLDPTVVPPTDFESHGLGAAANADADALVVQRARSNKLSAITLFPDSPSLSPTQLGQEVDLANARKFMLLATSTARPSDAFVSIQQKGVWYSILDDDLISKRTLALINQFNTVQAVPSPSSPLTPTISVGGR